MDFVIKANNIPIGQPAIPVSFSVEQGSITVISTTKEENNNSLARLFLGLTTAEEGQLFVFDKDMSLLSRNELLLLRQRLSLVYANGGLISNLKVWENVTLPLAYMGKFNVQQIEERGLGVLQRLGYSGKLMELPGLISFYQKKIAGMARAMLTDPDVMVFESPLQGLNQEEGDFFLRVAQEFHREKDGRTTIFLSSTQDIIPMLENANIVTLSQRLP